MKKVILFSSDNIASHLIKGLNDNQCDNFVITEYNQTRPSVDQLLEKNYDTIITELLSQAFEANQPDSVILPYSFSEENYSEYTGLRWALHIRLMDWQYRLIPIFFVGPDNPMGILKMTPLGSILITPKVFVKNTSSPENLITFISERLQDGEWDMTDIEYQSFLNRITIPAPANYTTHHSIANEWGILRWINTINWMQKDKPALADKDFANMLYFKYLLAKAGFGNKPLQNFHPTKDNLKGETFAFIDDEYHKGWDNLLGALLSLSGAELKSCDVFTKEKSQDVLLKDIEHWIDNFEDYCNKNKKSIGGYILDLRLHDDDFRHLTDSKSDKTIDIESLSGHKVSNYILNKNRANQIVIFTASNKVWNMKEELNGKTDEKINKHVAGYIVKESPEQMFSPTDSERNINEFLNCLSYAVSQKYIHNYVMQLDKINDDFYGKTELLDFCQLLLLDKDKGKDQVLSTLILKMLVWLEGYVEGRFDLEEKKRDRIGNCDLIIKKEKLKKGENPIVEKNIRDRILFPMVDRKKQKIDPYITKIYRETLPLQKGRWESADISSPILRVIAAMSFCYRIPDGFCQKYLDFKKVRNNSIAHKGGVLSAEIEDSEGRKSTFTPKIEDVKDFYSNVIQTILKKDFK